MGNHNQVCKPAVLISSLLILMLMIGCSSLQDDREAYGPKTPKERLELRIVMDSKSGEIIEIRDEHNRQINRIRPDSPEWKSFWDPAKERPFIAAIFHTHSSPGCVWVLHNGWLEMECN